MGAEVLVYESVSGRAGLRQDSSEYLGSLIKTRMCMADFGGRNHGKSQWVPMAGSRIGYRVSTALRPLMRGARNV